MSRRLLFLLLASVWVSTAAMAQTFTISGGGVTQSPSLVLAATNVAVVSPPGTLSFSCQLVAFAPAPTQQNWSCSGGSFSFQSSDGALGIVATFTDGRFVLTASGGGRGNRTSFNYQLTANFSGTSQQNGQPAVQITGTITLNLVPMATQLASAPGAAGSIQTGSFTISSPVSPALTYTVGGTVSGLASQGTVVVQDNGGDNLSLVANGAFIFPTAIANGAGYNVTVLTQPVGQDCTVANGTGSISSAIVTNVVVVTCQSLTVTITSPTSSPTYTSNSSPINIAGTASGNVTQVSWANSGGGSGTATGTTSWSASGIVLTSGANLITVTARDAGGISVTATLTVTYNPPTGGPGDLSGMTIWAGKWFKVEITQRGEDKPGAVAYLKVQSWDTGARILHATLYSLNSSTKHWDSTDLSLRYTSGTPLKFMFSFDYEGILGFTGKVDGETRDGATLAKATFRATGLSQAKKHGEAEDDDNVISIKGDLTSNLPSGL